MSMKGKYWVITRGTHGSDAIEIAGSFTAKNDEDYETKCDEYDDSPYIGTTIILRDKEMKNLKKEILKVKL